MGNEQKTDSLAFLISDTGRLLRKRFDQRAREFGLTRAQWQVMAYLLTNEGINQSGLAELLEIEPITLSRHIDRMEEAGLVERSPDPKDRRARILAISEKGNEVFTKLRAVGACLMEEITAGIPAEQQEIMKAGLKHLRGALASATDDRAPARVSEIRIPKRATS